ncbi:MAG: polysulfide reductase NrfD [Verrucomicrobiales bacterium]|jgi:molybdopterin-containing oxidoreductase family membrane subunit|nr:polysulfide reductase NrfD [Verrucomicrobiales bacterium]MDP4638681.1 polysulfide reductase NrfD [Verrucomicrobiales bacterium]MDP4793159.1 polysulfide reductase NrfD [Verrucomicrobiales bacterium]MDP4938037.1 polysulfide reductase NrfD [Verrucomicrobiales bacterium]MDP5006980.1 polysulfide reductase NrfD [Verrucomicrobiales bacterium]
MADTKTANTAVHPTEAEGVVREPLVLNNRSLGWITERICGIVENRQPFIWWVLFVPSVMLFLCLVFSLVYLVSTGVGVWGMNQPVAWGWDIVNFVFWIGIGHAGTLISAILFLTRQKWRTSVNRASEAMTLIAVMCAGIFPGFHVGRFWMVWFLAPVPNSNAIWQNFKSPLLWDVFAVSTYFTVSVIFWYIGLIPDLATLRDRAKGIAKKLYGFFALGWRGGNRQWRHYEMAYLILAALSTPLVLSVHSVVSFDFATSVIPGWHTTIFPPYFVAGAIFGGFAMVLTLMLPVRKLYGLEDLITAKHIDNMAKIILLTGTIVGYAYIMELFISYYSANKFEGDAFHMRILSGPYTWAYYCMFFCNVIAPQVFWFHWARHNLWMVFIIVNFVNFGMWFERFVIIPTSLARDFLPGQWGYYSASWVEKLMFAGSFGMFFMLFLIFIRFLPVIAVSEVKGVLPESDPHYHDWKRLREKRRGAIK